MVKVMFWFRKTHLPFPEGKYIPGCLDLMTDYDKNGVFLRLYYPTDLKGQLQDYSSKWVRWLPSEHYYRGLAKVVMIWLSVLKLIFWFYSGKIYIPVVANAKPSTQSKMKCIVMSHGLGATRYLYSTLCVDLASRGYLVACIEHRDESSCSTYYFKSKSDVIENKETYIKYAPIPLGEHHFEVRNRQVNYRSDEAIKTVNLLHSINNGTATNILTDQPNYDNTVNLHDFQNLLDLDDLTMMGHSFGGATTLLTLKRDQRITKGVLLDPWMFSIKNETFNLPQPLLFVNTQTFHIRENIRAMDKVVGGAKTRMFTILHTTHESQCDSVFTCGYWLNWFMKKLEPIKAHRINLHLILEFLDGGADHQLLALESHNYVEGLTKAWL